MTSQMEAVSIGVTAHLIIDGNDFELTSMDTTMVSQGISRAMCRPAIGLKASKAGISSTGSLRFDRGTPAQIILDVKNDVTDPRSGAALLTTGSHLAFDGLYDDAGPSDLSNGMFAMQVQLVSKYAQLDTGSLQYASLFPNSFIDTTCPINPTGNGLPGQSFDSQLIMTDFWAALVDVLNAIATSGVTGEVRPALVEYETVFGNDTNTAAASILNQILGQLQGGPFANPTFAANIATFLNVLFTQDMRYQSFLHRIVAIGQEFKYRLMEHPLGLAVVPYSPFFSTPHTIIAPSSIHSANWAVGNPGNCLGVAMTLAGGNALGNGQFSGVLTGAFKRKGYSSVLGTVTSLPCPPWMVVQDLIGSDPETKLPVGGSFDIREVIGDGYAKELALEYAYVGRSVQVACPLRMDIGPLTAVELQYPQLPGINLGTSIFGSVQMVKLLLDASSKRAMTILELGYVRSQIQQEAEFGGYEHPIWLNSYLGGRLDERPAV